MTRECFQPAQTLARAYPQEAISSAQSRPGHRSLVDDELVAQGQVLESELAVAGEDERQESRQVEQKADHRADFLWISPTISITWRRTKFWRRTDLRHRHIQAGFQPGGS
jgi:hypothetical protein